jgi:hypothetical protein
LPAAPDAHHSKLQEKDYTVLTKEGAMSVAGPIAAQGQPGGMAFAAGEG